MNKFIFFLLLSSQVFGSAIITAPHYARFGDQLLLYYEAKYLAWYLDIPFLYQPFKGSQLLNLHVKERPYNPNAQQYRTRKPAHYALQKLEPQTLYEVRFGYPVIPTPQREEAMFLEHMRKMIAPRIKVNEIPLPKDRVTVAVHVRKGSGNDKPLISLQEYTPEDILNAQNKPTPKGNYVDLSYPAKFPPDQYYIDQIKSLSERFEDAPMYVYIFTDDQNPETIVERYKDRVNKPNIVFDSRENKNKYSRTFIEDFFSMMKFDCVIRPSSSFSAMAVVLGYCKLAISPKKTAWVGGILVVEEVQTIVRKADRLSEFPS
jgi:hypothetical protein